MKYNITNIDWDLEDDENTLQASEIDLPIMLNKINELS